MLSILIPVYNWDVKELISQLYKQINLIDIIYEIVVIDDASDETWKNKNKEVEELENLTYIQLEKNIGRASIRNRLAEAAKHEWLLFIDSDCLVADDLFVGRYADAIQDTPPCLICGGLVYSDQKPDKEYLLHWKYGHKREAIDAEKRARHPSWYVHGSNVLVSASIWGEVPMDSKLDTYGYEDIAWGQSLTDNSYEIIHINNPVLHNGLKTNQKFMADVKSSISNLSRLYLSGRISETKLLQAYHRLDNLKLLTLFRMVMKPLKGYLEDSLLDNDPNLSKVDILKLYYLAESKKIYK